MHCSRLRVDVAQKAAAMGVAMALMADVMAVMAVTMAVMAVCSGHHGLCKGPKLIMALVSAVEAVAVTAFVKAATAVAMARS